MSSSLHDSFDQLGGVDAPAASTQLFDNDSYRAFSNFPDPESVVDEPTIYVSGGDEFLTFSTGEPFDGGDYPAARILPPLEEMQPEEGSALREWRRQNAVRLEEKEKREKELVDQIIDEANEYKINFLSKRKVTCETKKSTNREKEKVFVAGQEKFYSEADKSYWKSIAELIPNEVQALEKKRGKKDQDKKPSVVVIQGPKPGKPTDLSRMRQILIKLKHNTPPHLQPFPPSAPAGPTRDSEADTAATPGPTPVASSVQPVAVS